jgi:N6-adenosine-specific RNA methylase IME4
MSKSYELILLPKAEHEIDLLSKADCLLAEARTIADVLNIRAEAQATKVRAGQFYAKQTDLCRRIVVNASAIMVMAERRLGEILRTLPLAKSSPGNQYAAQGHRSHDATGPILLKTVGVSKSRSSRAQQVASLPLAAFNRYIQNTIKSDQEPTIAGVLRLAKQQAVNDTIIPENDSPKRFVRDVRKLIAEGRRFSTIYADPPWKYDNQGTWAATNNHYPTMTVEQIAAEPVADLAADNCHLHLWTTNGFLPAAFPIIEAWGFTYKSMFVWVKPTLGIGNYWRCSHEILLFACKGHLPFRDQGQRSWIELDRQGHSQKPEEIRTLVEKVSTGPYLELFGRAVQENPAWTVFGYQLDRP